MKRLLFLSFLIPISTLGQIDASYLESFKKKPKSFTLDIIEQKRKENTLEVRKITRYELELDYSLIAAQTVYDTMSGVPYNKRVSYTYSDDLDKNLTTVKIVNFKDELVSQVNYQWDSRALLLIKATHINSLGEEVKTITYDLAGCDSSILEGLDKNDVANCETAITHNMSKKFKMVKAFGMFGLAKEVSYKDLETISYSTVYFYDDNGLLIREEKTTSSGRTVVSTYTYNEQGDRTQYKAGYVEFNYEYTYDEHGNWLTKKETPKSGSIERLYKRVFVYR